MADGAPQPADPGELPPAADLLVVDPGPRADWFTADATAVLVGAAWTVRPASDRTALRLAGPTLRRARPGELPSEGLVPGAVQVPPDGSPVVFLANHPTTGGYPVLAVVRRACLPLAAQARPGATLRFATAG